MILVVPKGWERVRWSLLKVWEREQQFDLLDPVMLRMLRKEFLFKAKWHLKRVGPSHGIENRFLDVSVHPL